MLVLICLFFKHIKLPWTLISFVRKKWFHKSEQKLGSQDKNSCDVIYVCLALVAFKSKITLNFYTTVCAMEIFFADFSVTFWWLNDVLVHSILPKKHVTSLLNFIQKISLSYEVEPVWIALKKESCFVYIKYFKTKQIFYFWARKGYFIFMLWKSFCIKLK